ncbi:MAG: hypothetical protein IJD37_04020 [Clostridia bacterium]|nr:hypothetical protein [Clostridia bacterium]
MNEQNYVADVQYLKTIMKRSEFSYKHFGIFFIVFACAKGLCCFFDIMITPSLIEVFFNRGLFESEIRLYFEMFLSLVYFLIELAVILGFRKIVKRENLGISLWIFDFLSYVLIFCGFLLPFANYPIAWKTAADNNFFKIAVPAICFFVCGMIIKNKFFKIISFVYVFIAVAGLFIAGVIINGVLSERLSSQYQLQVSLILTFFYNLYPIIAYNGLGILLLLKSKGE